MLTCSLHARPKLIKALEAMVSSRLIVIPKVLKYYKIVGRGDRVVANIKVSDLMSGHFLIELIGMPKNL